MENYIKQSDFDCVGLVAKHCDLSKLCIAINESETFDLVPLFCFDFVSDVLRHWTDTSGKYYDLINGGNYTDDSGRTHQNLGLKKVWIYYAYARYVLINQINDTANGTVRKQNEWSVPTPLKEVNDISNKYRNMGKYAFESVQEYLCTKKNDFPKFDDCGCVKTCGCSGKCNCGKTKKITGFKFSTVRR
ncbi:MAG: hypothetical protein ACRC8Z_03220 [Empedobacter falsenii]